MIRKNETIFVAGGTGMVGAAIIRRLVAEGYTSIASNYHSRSPSDVALPLSSTGGSPFPPIRWSPLDLRRQSDTEAFFEKERPEYVFLAAAKVGGILANNTYKAEFIYDNIAMATNIINSSYQYKVKKLLNLGSSCIYPRHAPQPIKEEYLLTGPLEPTNEPYAIAKIAAIKLCRYFNEQYGTNFISLMPTNLYGPNDNFNLETSHVLPALLRKFHLAKLLLAGAREDLQKDVARYPLGFGLDKDIMHDRPDSVRAVLQHLGITDEYVTLWGSGKPYREFLHVDDLADAALFLMNRYDYKEIGELVNVGSGEDMSLNELALLAKEIVGFSGQIRHDRSKPDGMPKKLLDVTLINKLGWRVPTGLREGVKKTYAWYLQLTSR